MANHNEEYDGSEIRSMRKEAGYTLEELAHMVGITRKTLGDIENNKTGAIDAFSLKLSKKIYRACNQKISDDRRTSFIDSIINFFADDK